MQLFFGRLLGFGLLGAVMGGPAAAATVSLDRDAFIAAQTVPLVFETFDEDIPTADSIRFASGITSTKSSPGVPPTLNRVRFGSYDGFVVRDGFREISWAFATPIFAFGGEFSGAGSAFTSLMVTGFLSAGGSTETFSITDLLGNAAGFFGLSSDQPLSSVLFTTQAGFAFAPGATPVGGQPFSVDNVVLAPIPLPPAFALMLAALGAGAFVTRRRRTA